MIKRAATLVVALTMTLGGLAALVVTGDLAGAQRPPEGDRAPESGERGEGAEGSRPPEGSDEQRPRRHHRGHHLAGAVHGDLIVRAEDGTFVPLTFDRGTVAAKGASAFTIERPDGVEVRLQVTDDTRYRGVQSYQDLAEGAPAMVRSRDGVALVVVQPTEEQRERMEERRRARDARRGEGPSSTRRGARNEGGARNNGAEGGVPQA